MIKAALKNILINIVRILVSVLCAFLLTDAYTQNITTTLPRTISDFRNLPETKWKFKTKTSFFSSPVVSENMVYIGGLDSVLYAIDITSGKEKWRFITKGEIRSNVCIGDRNLYLNGGDGTLYSINKITGRLIWSFLTRGEKKYDFADYFHSTPVLNNGLLYFGSGDGNLYAVDQRSGALVWQFKTANIVHTTPAIDNDKIFFGSLDGFVYALNISNGELIWKFKTVGHRFFPAGEVQGSPSVFKDLVFIGARDYNVYALDQNKGYCHWNKSFTRGWGLCNNIHDSVLYIGSADERVLIAVDPSTGKEFWNNKMEFLVFGNNGYSDSLMYVGTTIGKLHGIKMTDGKKMWSFETDSYRKNRFKYFKQDDSYRDDIYSIIKSNEQFLAVECELGGIFSTPYISNDEIIFSSTDGILYCLKR
jgi:eukaryotic-like serine/threonine-protein kinase